MPERCQLSISFFQNFQNMIVFKKKLCWYMIQVSNNLDLRWGPTFCGASSGSKKFAKLIKGIQSPPLTVKKFRIFYEWISDNLIR